MSQSTPSSRSASRDRLLAFAFAGSELLVEIEPNATITWAAGAFQSRFGQSADSFVGSKLSSLVTSADHEALGRALLGIAMRGHIAPVILHLNDAAASPCTLAALKLPGPQARICMTFGPLPAAPPAKSQGAQPAAVFAREAEAQLRTSQAAVLGLLDVQGWAEATASLNTAERGTLRDELGEALGTVAGSDATIGDIAEGRFGVVSRRQLDVDMLASGLEALIQAKPIGGSVSVDGTAIDLAEPGLEPTQAVRALRFALSKFAAGGSRAIESSGFAAGLTGFLAKAREQIAAVRAVIVDRQFEMVFQPVAHLGNRTVHHYEALLRPCASEGMLWQSTQDFVTCAETLGLSEDLDLAVLQQVLAVLAREPDCSIAANISGMSMQSVVFRKRLLALLPSGSYRRLLIELTETAEIQDMAAAAATLDRLRSCNIGLCLDDFGAGAAAFRYLRDFPMDYVKIDGAYVQAALHSKRERDLVTSMIVAAHSAGAQAIAEMIETKEQANLMQELGSTFGQGWLLGRPGPLPIAT
jgi:EAL domain-containing protein (putative c-di-GMP-specific phosphodiesterase class I)